MAYRAPLLAFLLAVPFGTAPAWPQGGPIRLAQMSGSDLVVRLERMENHLRQLTGTIEQLQYRNQQLEGQIKRMQEDVEFRLQELGSKGAPRTAATPPRPTAAAPAAPAPSPPPAAPQGRRSDAFDPTQDPVAPGAPRTLGSLSPQPPAPAPVAPPGVATGEGDDEGPEPPPVGAPGGRQAGTPFDLSTLLSRSAGDPPSAEAAPPPAARAPAPPPSAGAALPPPPPRNPNATGVVPPAAGPQTAALGPNPSAKDQYDLAYGYVLRKDYALAEESFRSFLAKHSADRLAGEAQYWLGESLFQRQRFREAAESFLTVSTKYDKAVKAPDALLRLGQSLGALGEKEASCATLGEVGRRYPRASASVKQSVEREQKRARC